MKVIVGIVILILTSSNLVLAQNNSGGAKAGLIYGYNVPDADNTKPHRAWGLTGSAMISANISFGGYYILADKQEGTGGRQFETSLHGLSLSHNIPASNGVTFMGIRAGISKLETTDVASGDELIYSPYHWGIAAGYDHKVASFLSIGFEGSYLIFDDSETSTNGATYTEDSFRSIMFAVSTKILF